MRDHAPSHSRRLALRGLSALGAGMALPWPLRAGATASQSDWLFEIVHDFDSDNDGYQPPGDLLFGPGGLICGVTPAGGRGGTGAGNVYVCSPVDGSFSVLSQFFDSEDLPGSAAAGVVLGGDGRLWGTSWTGGHQFRGTVYTVSLDGQLELQAEFADNDVGEGPQGGVIEARPGRFYGTTPAAVYELDARPGRDHGLKALHRFDAKVDGFGSSASLTDGGDGWLYGCNPFEGPKGHGTLFRVALRGGGFEVLKVFDGNDGATAGHPLLKARDGAFHGTTFGGGRHGLGVAFRLGADGSYAVLHHFAGGRNDAAIPSGGLCEGLDGAMYGGSYQGGNDSNDSGTVYRLTRRGHFSLLHRFKPARPGGYSCDGRLAFGPDGRLYGTTRFVPGHLGGTLFRLTPPGIAQATGK